MRPSRKTSAKPLSFGSRASYQILLRVREQARERGARHVAGLGQVFHLPRPFGRFQHAGERVAQAAVGQDGEQAGRLVTRAGQPGAQQQREQGARQLGDDDVAAGPHRGRLVLQQPHERMQAGEVIGAAGAHDHHVGQGAREGLARGAVEHEAAAQDRGGGAIALVALALQRAVGAE